MAKKKKRDRAKPPAESGARTSGSAARTTESRTTESRTTESRTTEFGTAESRSAESRTADKRTAESRSAESLAAPAEEPVFWFGFEVAWAKLALARVVVFGLLAVDAVLQIRHAPRYGAGGFNVAQLPGLDWLGASRGAYGTAELVNAYLFVLIACGLATRWLLPIATTIYAWLYFGSQLDSYQHHYLVAMILLVACFVPWQRPTGDAAPETPIRAWAVRVILVELGILYLWAAISKMNHAWIDGTTLSGQIAGTLRSMIDGTVGIAVAAVIVIVIELVLAATVWLKPAWRFAAPLGIALHVGILASGLEIGLFAWLMLGLYVLIVPDRIWVEAANSPLGRELRRAFSRATGAWVEGRTGYAITAVAIALGIVVAAWCRFEAVLAVAIVATVVVGCAIGTIATWGTAPARARRIARIATIHVLAVGTWFAVDRATTVAYDYYKFWGGTSRRFKDPDAAEHAYRRLIAIAPDDPTGHYQLGRVLLEREAADDGLAELHEAERLDGRQVRAFVYEARWLASHGRMPEALEKARAATAADPADADARHLLSMLEAGTAPPRPSGHDD
jgi:vitamin K-dependent gamma-carboxylase-like protein